MRKKKALKRTRRIEIIRYTRRLATHKDETRDHAESADVETILEALGNDAFHAEQFSYETRSLDTIPGTTFLQHLLKLRAIREHSQFESEEQNIKKENEP